MRSSIILALAFCYQCVNAIVKVPSEDPFYKAPTHLDQYKPGDILRSRKVENTLPASFPNAKVHVKGTWQYLYRTTDSLGKAAAAVTTLIIPKNAHPRKLLLYQTAYDACYINCSQSYFLQAGSDKNASDSTEMPLIIASLNQGWYVSSPDYEGLDAAYVAGVISGQATIDSVRAVLKTQKATGLSPKASYVMWGYSGGSLASEWAAELQPTYAPELQFQGAALGGLVPNVTNILLTINGGIAAGLITAGMLGLAKAYPKFMKYLDANLVPSKAKTFKEALTSCYNQDSSMYMFQNIFSYFKKGKATIYDPIRQAVIAAAGQMGTHGVPTMPLYVYKAVADEISPIADTTDVVKKLCRKGTLIEYQKDLVGDHLSEGITGAVDAFAWIKDRLDGVKAATPCKTRTVAVSSLDPDSIKLLGADVYAILEAELATILTQVSMKTRGKEGYAGIIIIYLTQEILGEEMVCSCEFSATSFSTNRLNIEQVATLAIYYTATAPVHLEHTATWLPEFLASVERRQRSLEPIDKEREWCDTLGGERFPDLISGRWRKQGGQL